MRRVRGALALFADPKRARLNVTPMTMRTAIIFLLGRRRWLLSDCFSQTRRAADNAHDDEHRSR